MERQAPDSWGIKQEIQLVSLGSILSGLPEGAKRWETQKMTLFESGFKVTS